MMAAAWSRRDLDLPIRQSWLYQSRLSVRTASEFLRLYPSANILVATERDFEKAAESSSYQGLQLVTMTVSSCHTHSLRKSQSPQRERSECLTSRLMKSAMRLMR